MQRTAARCFVSDDGTRAALERALADRRLGKLVATIEDGGLIEARAAFAEQPSPPLLIIGTGTTDAEAVLDRVDGLAEVCRPETQLILMGGANDVELFRRLARRGVADYLPAPVAPDALAQALVELMAGPAVARAGAVVAFLSAKGGAGGSTLAHNVAHLLSRPADMDALVVDLDLAFGSADIGFNIDPNGGTRNLLAEPERIDAALLDRFATRIDDRLRVLTAPGRLEPGGAGIEAARLEAMLEALRPTHRVVVLDLPRVWNNATQTALRLADVVVLTTLPDLAALRATRELLDWLERERGGAPAPLLAMNMAGGDRKSTVEGADFVASLGAAPTVTIPFDGEAFRQAVAAGEMLETARPKSRAAGAIRDLARAVTARIDPRRAVQAPSQSPLGRLLALAGLSKGDGS